MGVDVPDLDDRTYAQFLEDARKRIPAVAEEWTDHNAHDPGITLLELFAWLAEAHAYRLDRVEDRHRRKYLQLLGVSPNPPQSASGTVRIDPSPSLAGVEVPNGTSIVAESRDPDDHRTVGFRTDGATSLSAATVDAVHRKTRDGIVERTDENRTDETYFRAFGPRAEVGSVLYVGFAGDPFADPTAAFSLWVDHYDDNLPDPASHGSEASTFEPSVSLAWEYCRNYDAWDRNAAWERLEVVDDGTDALYHKGQVTLKHPDPSRWPGVDEVGVAGAEPGRAWIRVRLERTGYEIPPQIDRLSTNVVRVTHHGTVGPEKLSTPEGDEETSARPGQRFEFDRAPVLEADLAVGGERWERVDDLDGSAPDDRHYVLEREAGAVRFGDNVRGSVPEPEQSVVATRYAFGGGPAGNVGSDVDWRIDPTKDGPASSDDVPTSRLSDASVSSHSDPVGGRSAESVTDAFGRLTDDLAVPYRTVTAADYEYVATHTPGLRFGRAKAVVSRTGSAGDCADRDGVRVVVVPYATTPRPMPSDGFLEAVHCHLQRHRLVTDRVEAVPPTYVGIGVRAVVRLHDGYTAAGRTAAIESALDTFLSPLSGYDGTGWPFGRPVYRSELSAAIDAVEGVDCVHDLSIDADAEPGTDLEYVGEGVRIDPEALVYPTDHAVAISDEHRTCREVGR